MGIDNLTYFGVTIDDYRAITIMSASIRMSIIILKGTAKLVKKFQLGQIAVDNF